MTEPAEVFDRSHFHGAPEHIAIPVVSSSARTSFSPAEITVMNAVRYLLDRYELSSGSADFPQRIAVVSASAGEGVTTVSLALAEVLASQRENSVCWIDVGRTEPAPTRRSLTAVVNHPAASTNIEREVTVDENLRRPSLPVAKGGLSTVSLRSVSGRPDLDVLTKELAAEYRHLVFDVPPILSDAGSIGFLRNADAYLLVTRQGSTSTKQTRALAEALETIPSLGAILNDYRTRTPRFIQRFFSD
jgi:Mrp family chromosome partitioning ATPase